MVTGHREAAVTILGMEVMAPAGLLGLALSTLAYSLTEIANIFSVLSRPSTYPVLIHCTQGKDRTGLIVVLVLLLLNLPSPARSDDSSGDGISVNEAIAADYMASARELVPEKEDRLRELREMGLGADFAECEPGFVEEIRKFLQECGGVERYLERVGVLKDAREGVRKCLIVE